MSWAASPPAQVAGSAVRRTLGSASAIVSVAGAGLVWLALLGPVIALLAHLSWHSVDAALTIPGALDPLVVSLQSGAITLAVLLLLGTPLAWKLAQGTLPFPRIWETGVLLSLLLPLLVAPTMNVQMWNNPATQRNVERLRADGVEILGPGSGGQACGEVGDGRMIEPEEILAALIAVYIILGMLYESTIHPITIISTLPSAGLGALLTLMLFGMPLDVIGIIGIILLIGIVKKNGIMLVDFALVGQRERGLSTEKAIHEACRLRFRPILMTTMCALLGGVPLMLGTGIGSEIRQPLGYAIVGGLLVSQLLTLFTTPVVYIYMDRLGHWLGRDRAATVEAKAPAQ